MTTVPTPVLGLVDPFDRNLDFYPKMCPRGFHCSYTDYPNS